MATEINAMTTNDLKMQLPPMAWAAVYTCPEGHTFEPTVGVYNNHAWVAHPCKQCTKQAGIAIDSVNRIYYTREQWEAGQQKLQAVAFSINMHFIGKVVKCEFCSKVIPAINDKAYHLQKHFSIAITAEDEKFLAEVAA